MGNETMPSTQVVNSKLPRQKQGLEQDNCNSRSSDILLFLDF